jgi:hypothetical protein
VTAIVAVIAIVGSLILAPDSPDPRGWYVAAMWAFITLLHEVGG